VPLARFQLVQYKLAEMATEISLGLQVRACLTSSSLSLRSLRLG
jgi:hypothetical protein